MSASGEVKRSSPIDWAMAREREISLSFLILTSVLLIFSSSINLARLPADHVLCDVNEIALLSAKCVGLAGLVTSLGLSILKKKEDKK